MSVTWGYRAVVMTLDEAPPRSVSPTRRGHALAEHRRGGWQILAVFQVAAKARPSRSSPTFSDGGAASSGWRPTSAAGQMPPGRMDGDRCRGRNRPGGDGGARLWAGATGRSAACSV